MPKYRIKFRIGDIFSPDDIISQRIISLCMAINDLTYVTVRLVKEASNHSIGAKMKMLYLFRLSCSHLWEAIQVIEKMEKQPQLEKIFNKLPNKSKQRFEQLKKEYSSLRKVLRKIRNNFFHYMKSEDIKCALKDLRNANSEIPTRDKIDDVYFPLGDAIILNTFKRELDKSGLTLENSVGRIQNMAVYFWKLFDDLVTIYLTSHPEEKYSLEKV